MEQLSGLDAAFVYAETAGAAHVTFFAIYDPSTPPGGTVTVDDVAAQVDARLGTDPVFRSVLARVPFDLDHPYWVRDEHFELSRHLHHLTLPRPGGWRQLCDQVSQLHAARMDLRRPPWEGYFIDGLGTIEGNVISYCGRVVVSINGCPVVLPDIDHYGDCMDASFAELTSGAGAVGD
jgi:diacylglycerol O-acyltransferase / wax synthase